MSGASLDGSAEFGRHDPATPKPPARPGPRYLIDAKLDRVVLGKDRALSQVVLKADHEWRHNETHTENDRWNLAMGYLF